MFIYDIVFTLSGSSIDCFDVVGCYRGVNPLSVRTDSPALWLRAFFNELSCSLLMSWCFIKVKVICLLCEPSDGLMKGRSRDMDPPCANIDFSRVGVSFR